MGVGRGEVSGMFKLKLIYNKQVAFSKLQSNKTVTFINFNITSKNLKSS